MTATLRKANSGHKIPGGRIQDAPSKMKKIPYRHRAIIAEILEDRRDIEIVKERLGGPRTRVNLEDL